MTDDYRDKLAMVEVVAGVVIEKDGKYLLVQEKQQKAYKKWNFPAGKVDKGESLEQAAVREAKEECGLDVEILEHLFVYHIDIQRPILHAFSTKLLGGIIQVPEDEIIQAGWFSLQEIVDMKPELINEEYILGSIENFMKDDAIKQ